MYVVCVDFELRPGAVDAFLPLMLQQAANSLENEPNCHVFDVCQSNEAPGEVFLYEVYENRAAFDTHLASDYFKTFDAAVSPMVAKKTVRNFVRM